MHGWDPFNATVLGVPGFDALVPDPGRAAAETVAGSLTAVAGALDDLGGEGDDELGPDDAVDRDVLRWLATSAAGNARAGLWDTSISASRYASPQAMVFQAVPTAPILTTEDAEAYLGRLDALPHFVSGLIDRYRSAAEHGRPSPVTGIEQALDQLDRVLATPLEDDPLLAVHPGPGVDAEDLARRARDIVSESVRPAWRRLEAAYRELEAGARSAEHVGLCWVPGGEEDYRGAVHRHTTTDLPPERIHRIGLEVLERLDEEWAEIGAQALGVSDPAEVRRHLREDPGLRAKRPEDILDVVTAAVGRAEAARDDWFPALDVPPCRIEPISALDVRNAPTGNYRGPSADGTRPGALQVLTAEPEERSVFEFEAIAFHEGTPGHHMQISSAQRLTGLPTYRRFLDTEVTAYVEGWGLYSERLADEMGLYSSPLQRLGMLSGDAIRASRLVVDTGMHRYGWSRDRAVEFMVEHTATTRPTVVSEIDRYIAWPGQCLGYMIGRRTIERLRREAAAAMGPAFDVKGFHGAVLGQGALPLTVLESVVHDWAGSAQ